MKKVSAKIESSKGFYLGDICHVLGDDIYHGVWGKLNGYNEGTFDDPSTGLKVAVSFTAFGDGTYTGSDGTIFPVDAGVIGLVPLELVEKHGCLECGKVVKTPGLASFLAENGIFSVTFPDGNTVDVETR